MMRLTIILSLLALLMACVNNSGHVGQPLPKVFGSQYPLNQQIELAGDHYNSGKLSEAEKVYLNIVDIHPRVAEAWYKLGNIYYRTGRYDASVEAYQNVIKIDSTNDRAWYNLSLARLSQAVEVLNFGLESMDNESLYYRKSLLLRDGILGRVSKASEEVSDKEILDTSVEIDTTER